MAAENEPEAIEKDFLLSWDSIERYYTTIGSRSTAVEFMKSILDLIALLRKRGYDRQFRAGSSLSTLILSRSREHGLRTGQARIRFDLLLSGGMTVVYYQHPDTKIQLDVERVELTPEVEELLQRLLAQLID